MFDGTKSAITPTVPATALPKTFLMVNIDPTQHLADRWRLSTKRSCKKIVYHSVSPQGNRKPRAKAYIIALVLEDCTKQPTGQLETFVFILPGLWTLVSSDDFRNSAP